MGGAVRAGAHGLRLDGARFRRAIDLRVGLRGLLAPMTPSVEEPKPAGHRASMDGFIQTDRQTDQVDLTLWMCTRLLRARSAGTERNGTEPARTEGPGVGGLAACVL